MYPAAIANFEHLLAADSGDALLRFCLGNEYLKLAAPTMAARHFAQAAKEMTVFARRFVRQRGQSRQRPAHA